MNANAKDAARTLAPVLTVKLTGGTWYEVFMLNPGRHFPRFGGSSAGLVVRKTASMIVREHCTSGMTRDVEHDIDDKSTWEWLAKLINSNAGHTATYGGQALKDW